MIEQTLSIIKPDAVERNLDNKIKYLFTSKPNKNSVKTIGVPSLENTDPKKFEAATSTMIKAVISKVLTKTPCNF